MSQPSGQELADLVNDDARDYYDNVAAPDPQVGLRNFAHFIASLIMDGHEVMHLFCDPRNEPNGFRANNQGRLPDPPPPREVRRFNRDGRPRKPRKPYDGSRAGFGKVRVK